jgi:plastocyanin
LSVVTTRWAVIPISDDAFLAPTPNPICACVGDIIEWTYANGSHTKDKDVYIEDTMPFLDSGDCKKSKSVKKDKQEKATCRVTTAMSGTYKYAIKGSHVLDPEVEVQGGIYPSTPPASN